MDDDRDPAEPGGQPAEGPGLRGGGVNDGVSPPPDQPDQSGERLEVGEGPDLPDQFPEQVGSDAQGAGPISDAQLSGPEPAGQVALEPALPEPQDRLDRILRGAAQGQARDDVKRAGSRQP